MKEPRAELDQLGLAISCGDFDQSGTVVQIEGYRTANETMRFRRKLPGGGFLATGVGGKAWVEASLPKRVAEDNVRALPLVESLEVARELYREAGEYAELLEPFEQARVVRADLVRDFEGVTNASHILDGLAASVPPFGRMKVRRFADVERNKAETVRVGPKAWGGILYDKHVESGGRAPGRLRSEFRLHGAQLTGQFAKYNGGLVREVRDLEEVKLQGIRRAFFERCGFEREVSGVGSVMDAVFNAEGLSMRERRELWCYLTARPLGADLGYSQPSLRKYERWAKRLGLALDGETLLHDLPEMTVRLDYDSGREVLRVA